jgi:serine protease Do
MTDIVEETTMRHEETHANRPHGLWKRPTWPVAGLALAVISALFLVLGNPAPADSKPVPDSFAELAKKASPSVVNIRSERVMKGPGQSPMPFGQQQDPMRDFFEWFFRDQMPRDFKQQALGTGFIIDSDGYILTNNHVVDKADEIKVKLADNTEYSAKVIGRDPKTDLALIRIEPGKPLAPLTLGDSEKLEVGEWVVAIGNPFGLGNTVTAGIVSAKYRQIGAGSYDNFIQTDASINPGNSGGPLLNTSGEAVGINTAIFSQTGGSIGIGFAIPINMAKELLPQLKQGKVVRGWLGVMIQKITPELKEKLGLKDEHGALVSDVTPGGPAEKAGIKRGDVIVSFDGKEIREMRDLPQIVGSTHVDKEVSVSVIRNAKKKDFEVKIGKLDEEGGPRAVGGERPELGFSVEEITPELANRWRLPETSGVVVSKVEGGSPAEEAGMKAGDVVLEIDQTPVRNVSAFTQKIAQYKKGDTILFLMKRGGSALYLTLKLGK